MKTKEKQLITHLKRNGYKFKIKRSYPYTLTFKSVEETWSAIDVLVGSGFFHGDVEWSSYKNHIIVGAS